jgi:antitoxin (DNA-binding transcriptional repressor) of toxin-antitoxin stability system
LAALVGLVTLFRNLQVANFESLLAIVPASPPICRTAKGDGVKRETPPIAGTLTGPFDVAIYVATRSKAMAKFATARDLKNQTTSLIREAEKGKAVVVTRRGKPVATLKAFEQKDLEKEERYPSSAYDNLKKKIAANYPKLKKESPEQARRRFDKITDKIRRSLPFKTWQEMNRFAKGDRHGLTR